MTDETVNTKVSLGFEQRQRASVLEESISHDELAAAYEIVFLRDRLAAMTDWLEQHQPDVFQRGLWEAISKEPRD